jgi:hypothetical protein
MAYHYNWRSITIHERTNPLRAINMVELSHLFYDYLALYKGANNSLSWRTRNRVVDMLRLARLTCRSPLGLLSVVQQVNRFRVIFNRTSENPEPTTTEPDTINLAQIQID